MRAIAFCLILGLASAAVAARGIDSDRPADVFAVADTASPVAELDAWVKVVAAWRGGTAMPPGETILPGLLGKLVGATPIQGVAGDKPLRALFLNPQKFAQPVVLSVAVRDLRALQASLVGTGLVAEAKRGYAVIGNQKAVDYVLGFMRRLPAPSAHGGVQSTLFVPPVWAAYGPQLLMAKSALLSQPQKDPQSAGLQTYAALVDQLLAGVAQFEELGVTLSIEHGQPQMTVRLDVQRGGTLDKAFSAQRPSDFALLSRLPASSVPFVGAGTLDIASLQGFFAPWFGAGSSASDAKELNALLDDFSRTFTGDLAMTGSTAGGGRMSFQYLAGVRDGAHTLDLFQRWYALVNRIGMFGGKAKTTQKPLAAEKYDGVNVSRTELQYDFSGVQGYKGPARMTGTSAYAAFDGLLAMVASTLGAADDMHSLIDSARHGKNAYQLEGSARAALEAARAARDSFWIWADFARLTPGAPPSLPRGTGLSLALGFAPGRARLRLALTGP
jgi:hypothetical protein